MHPPQASDTDIFAFTTIPEGWMPDAVMKRIVCHWSAGNYKASDTDRHHYHLMIEDDGRLVRGEFSIADNEDNLIWEPCNYAAHARGTNSNCIGVSVCCMKDAIEEPFDAGPAPMLKAQWQVMADICAQLCRRYAIPVTPQTVLGHGEVEAILANPQDGKWDPLALPWAPDLSKEEVGDKFRTAVRAILEKGG